MLVRMKRQTRMNMSARVFCFAKKDNIESQEGSFDTLRYRCSKPLSVLGLSPVSGFDLRIWVAMMCLLRLVEARAVHLGSRDIFESLDMTDWE